MEESFRANGEYHVEGFDTKTGQKVFDEVYHNVLTQGFFTAIFRFMNQAISAPGVSDLNLTHIATGTGTVTPVKTDTAMGNEQFRKAISSKSFTATKFISKLSLDTTESNFTITELGTFANGSDLAGSGTMISHAACNIPKNASIKYLVTYSITIQ